MYQRNAQRAAAAFAATLLASAVQGAFAAPLAASADVPSLEPIQVTGQREGSATYEAPSQGSLDAGQPQSIINQHFIQANQTEGANYTDIINIAPSVADTTPNGAGNAESLNLSIRGFQDGQFNVTFDGIPWGDSNDFTHHTTSYFTANTLGQILVDRGPGTASQIGNATFGGTVALQSRDPMAEHNVSAEVTLGTWRTNNYASQIDTGELSPGGGRAFVAFTSINTDGAMTNNGLERKNVMAKYVLPLGNDASLTAVAMYNTLHQNVGQQGTTMEQLAQYGSHYSLGTNPSSDSYYGYNYDELHTDVEYIQLKAKTGDIRLDNKAYSYAYYHRINETNDISLAAGSKGIYDGLANGDPTFNDVAGQKGWNNYRSVGDVFRAETDLGAGTLRAGLWYDYQWNDRELYDVDWTQGATFDAAGDHNGYVRLLHDGLTSFQGFVEYEFRPIDTVTITPGLRYSSFGRKIDAAVNPQNGLQTSSSNTWHAAQPSVYALWHPAASASVYAQYARGFLAPKDKLAYQPNQAAASEISAQHTTNLQAGGAWKTSALTLAADVYHIKFDNFVTYSGGGATTKLVGGGSAVFKGVEFEGTWAVGGGLALYGNATRNQQDYADGTKVQYAPDGTWSAGLIFDDSRVYASLMAKHIGQTYQGGNGSSTLQGGTGVAVPAGTPSYDTFNGAYVVPGFTTMDFNIGYNFKEPFKGAKDLKLRLKVANLANKESVYYVYGATLPTAAYPSGEDMFMTLPGRSYMVTMSADF